MRKFLAAATCAVVFSLGFVNTVRAENFAVYYIDMQKIINESPQGKKAKQELESKIKAAESKLKKLADEINALKKELSSPLFNDSTKKKKENELQMKIMEFRQLKQESEQMVAELQKKLTAKIVEDVFKVVAKYRKEHHLPMVVERNEGGIIAADPKYDITDKILKVFSKQGK
ncbi:OmpH family outer membrane protein [Desulfurobacterium atlanticum]|uniref:Periplasmic chaperone for outer membrane proteins Skp n=1 Tax=Desulfurobacterium atlanticum TaxID=240169 RepID=A0A238XQC6_9BACT|nr:OmpH family outer membrane protein [Desulfurobacterium atlanticum]SNR61236.1 periplasmic chaperone for outer membrane proteins Skp [Desulfurobacterium atlanticum]